MVCNLCGSADVKEIYCGKIRQGGIGNYTENDVSMYQCGTCDVIWHENVIKNQKTYYESREYRNSLEGGTEERRFYELHDKENFDKIYYARDVDSRNKIVADIGCGCGAFLDTLKGLASEIIAIEPSDVYRDIMKKKGFHTYPYTTEALEDYRGRVEVVFSFDVIEHVENPKSFMREINQLLSPRGKAIVGTPTDAPVMRSLLGSIYEKQLLFSTQHLWIFSYKSLEKLAGDAGFSDFKIAYFQRYGLSNLIAWIKEQKPIGHNRYNFVTEILDDVYRKEMQRCGLSDYIVIYLEK